MALSDSRFSNRRRALAVALSEKRLDSILVTDMLHVRYLSGFTGSNGALLVSKDLSALISTDGRYTTQLAEEVPDVEALIQRSCAAALLRTVFGPRRVAFEAERVTVAELERLKEAAHSGVDLIPESGLIEQLRLHKDNIEKSRLREVAELASKALEDLIAAGELAEGRTEHQVAADLEYRMRLLGAERTSFDTIVASGENSAKPHHSAGDRVIQARDLVTIDFGAHRRGYNSDMTRTFVIGEAGEFEAEIYDIVLRSQLAGVEAAYAGVALSEIDHTCRKIIEDAGCGEFFVHSTGHGIGLEVHEAPSASAGAQGILTEDSTLTIEPGIYVPGRGGVRIEDTLIITAGAPEIITKVNKNLRIV